MNGNRIGTRVVAFVSVFALLLAACGDNKDEEAVAVQRIGKVTPEGISPERCESNRAAGQLTYLTSFDYASSASIIDVVAADAMGYFKKMCLDIKLQPGFTTDNIPLVSSNKATFSSLGSQSEVANAVTKGAGLEAIAVYGHKSIEALAATEAIKALPDIKGSTMGVLGSIPFSIRLMLVRGGVPLDSFKQVQVPFDATLLAKGDFQSRPVYKSSEPRQLDAAHVNYHLFDPAAADVPASFGAMIVNKGFAQQNPTAVEDFLRADLAGFQYAIDHPDEAVGFAFKRSDPKYYLTQDGEKYRWTVESQLVKDSTPQSKPYGYMSESEWKDEVKPLVEEVKAIETMPDVKTFYDGSFLSNVYDGSTLVFPK